MANNSSSQDNLDNSNLKAARNKIHLEGVRTLWDNNQEGIIQTNNSFPMGNNKFRLTQIKSLEVEGFNHNFNIDEERLLDTNES